MDGRNRENDLELGEVIDLKCRKVARSVIFKTLNRHICDIDSVALYSVPTLGVSARTSGLNDQRILRNLR